MSFKLSVSTQKHGSMPIFPFKTDRIFKPVKISSSKSRDGPVKSENRSKTSRGSSGFVEKVEFFDEGGCSISRIGSKNDLFLRCI